VFWIVRSLKVEEVLQGTTVSKQDHLTACFKELVISDSCLREGSEGASPYWLILAHIQALGPFSQALVEAKFEIKWPRTKRIKSLKVVPATVEVVMVMSPTLLTLWIHGILTLVKLTPHLCRETEQDVITIEPSNNSVKYTTCGTKPYLGW